jgi:hypothetical protein
MQIDLICSSASNIVFATGVQIRSASGDLQRQPLGVLAL